MKKIPTLFERVFENHRIVCITDTVHPGMEWVLNGEGIATVKLDGSCCAIINGEFYKRFDAKIAKIDEKGGYMGLVNIIAENYEELQALNVPNEDARYVLPNACETSLYLSCNLRELIHLANERLCIRAQWEIRELVQQMVALVPEELHFMLVPKCKSGRIICYENCGGNKE